MTMRLTEGTIRAALDLHAKRYGQQRLWSVPYHVECWARGHEAFVQGSDADFDWLYGELSSRWQVFRSSNWSPPPATNVRTVMRALPTSLARRKLSDIAEPSLSDLRDIWTALVQAGTFKTNKDGPSLVALSKFLHFWNPRLFVIADREVIWNWVLGHKWLWDQVLAVKATLGMMESPEIRDPSAPEVLREYVALLVWAGRVLRANPSVVESFAEYVSKESTVPVPEYVALAEYEAAAVEWLLLGLVELPPSGVRIESGPTSE